MTPRLSVTSVALFMPVILRTLFSFSLPLRYSATVTSMPTLLISWNPASGPAVTPSPRLTRKLNCTYGRSRSTAMTTPPRWRGKGGGSAAAVRGPLADAEHDELRGADRGDADQADEPAVVQVVLRHRGAVAAHEERLL